MEVRIDSGGTPLLKRSTDRDDYRVLNEVLESYGSLFVCHKEVGSLILVSLVSVLNNNLLKLGLRLIINVTDFRVLYGFYIPYQICLNI